MRSKKKADKCPECGGDVLPGQTKLVYELQYRVQINNVPANVCTQCGEAFIAGRVAAEVDRLVNRIIEDVESFAKTQPLTARPSAAKEIAIAV
jgi:YgiT-type zinc finger domain-containing protein